jgi:outer membrane protein assembly factor BamE (lipoprotein component of BamABCDE complex)
MVVVAICCSALVARASEEAAAAQPAISEETFSKIKVGTSTQDEVKDLLGTPWRITNYGETYCGCRHTEPQEVWDYRGADASGGYKFHLEFDDEGIVRIAAKIPDAAPAASPQRSSNRTLRAGR